MPGRFTLLTIVLCAVGAVKSEAACLPELEPELESELESGGGVVEILDAETFVLDDGRVVRLAGIVSPRRPLWLDEGAQWHAAEHAEAALKRLVFEKQVAVAAGELHTDRHGRLVAQVIVGETAAADAVWVQGALVAAGQARAAARSDSRLCAGDLLVLDAEARAGGAGLWRGRHYRVRDAGVPDDISVLLNHFHLVEGTVLSVAERGRRLYLNFGGNYRDDFTVMVEARDYEAFSEAGTDLLGLTGARVRVRGWIRNFNGPMIEVRVPEQIEVLTPPPG